MLIDSGARLLAGRNRYIVECKVAFSAIMAMSALRRNRYIVECKGRCQFILKLNSIVEIDTLWNVKLGDYTDYKTVYRG